MVGLLAFAPDSKRLATGSAEGWACIWDVRVGELLQITKVANEPLKDLALSADGQQFIACTAEFVGEYDSNGYAEIWPCPDAANLTAIAAKRTFRPIAPEEAAQFGLSESPLERSASSTFHLRR
jgi:WD40 repeat protein